MTSALTLDVSFTLLFSEYNQEDTVIVVISIGCRYGDDALVLRESMGASQECGIEQNVTRQAVDEVKRLTIDLV
jgi:hypothetical protein